ncbi:MAG: c-type cytochrome [Actinomycetota bacterium]
MGRRTGVLVAAAVACVAGAWFMATTAGPAAIAQTPTPGPTPFATASPSPPLPRTPGADLYLRDCAWCHGGAGEGASNGPSLIGVGAASADFMLSTGRMPIAEADQNPQRAQVPYTRREIDGLVDFVASFGPGPPIPDVNVSRGSLADGEVLYAENCAACHGVTGAGGALTNGLIAPSLDASTPVEVAEAMRLGGAGLRSGNMPKFGPEALSDEQVDSVARYVQYLRKPDDRGGEPLGHFGPVPEGLVTWVVGLLALILVIRWIGTAE